MINREHYNDPPTTLDWWIAVRYYAENYRADPENKILTNGGLSKKISALMGKNDFYGPCSKIYSADSIRNALCEPKKPKK